MTNAEVLENLLAQARAVPTPELPQFLGAVEVARTTALARLTATTPVVASLADELIDISEAAAKLKMSKDWLYRNHTRLSFARKVGSRLLFSSAGIADAIRNGKL
jgi:hypothetical protein